MLKSKITPVLAATALVVAVFGSTPLGHAAASMVLPKRSVGTAQLKANAVVGTKIASNAVTSAKVKDGSLLAADFKPGQAPAGPQGPAGPKGDKGDVGAAGAPGISGYEVTDMVKTTIAPGGKALAVATCPPGKKVLGGGAGTEGEALTFEFVGTSGPTTYAVVARNPNAHTIQLQNWAICAYVS